jgi:lysyl-tRNA synthetase class 2
VSDKNNPAPAVAPPQDENQIIAERRAKLDALRTRGQAYPNDFRRDALAAELHGEVRRQEQRGARIAA